MYHLNESQNMTFQLVIVEYGHRCTLRCALAVNVLLLYLGTCVVLTVHGYTDIVVCGVYNSYK